MKIELKPFKFDLSDVKRENDLLRGVILFKECVRLKFDKSKLTKMIEKTRRDLCQYIKLKKRYTVINLDTLKQISKDFKIQISIWTRPSTRSKLEQKYITKEIYDYKMNVLGKYFNEGNNYSLDNLTLLIDVETHNNEVYKSLRTKITHSYSWTEALR